MRSFILGLLGVAASVVVACSGTTTGSSNPSSSSSPSGDGPGVLPALTGGASIDTSSVTSIVAGAGYCGGAPGKCYGQRSFSITFATSTLVARTCVEGDAGDRGETTRTLSAAQLQRVRDALAGLRVSSDPHLNEDGMMFGLTIATPSGSKDYSPEAACNHENFTKIAAGWDELWTTLTSL